MRLVPADIEAIAKAVADHPSRRDEPFYTVQTLAAKLSFSDRQVRRMIKEKRLDHYVIEGCYRFDPADVETYLQQRHEEAAR